MLHRTDDDELRAEVGAALSATVRHGWGWNHSLCHGDLGNLELLLEAAPVMGEERWVAELARASTVIVEDIERTGWRSANPGNVESPELMTGLAGIGYGLLRLADPARVPSVLVLAAPVPADTHAASVP